MVSVSTMPSRNRQPLGDRVARAAESALAEQSYVAPIDILNRIGWLDASAIALWRQGRLECLERALQVRPERVAETMQVFRGWAEQKGLEPSETQYVARDSGRTTLRFTFSGDADIERLYRTHWISSNLSARQRERLQEKASRPPELIAISPLNRDWKCQRCGGVTDFLMMEGEGPSCMNCVGLGGFVYLPAGDPDLTRRAKAKSKRFAVVLRFSRTRKRYERQGLLVKEAALDAAERRES
jgi:hypothetical protein